MSNILGGGADIDLDCWLYSLICQVGQME